MERGVRSASRDDVRLERAPVTRPRRWPIAFSSNAFIQYSLVDCARELRRVGYDAIEVLADVPHAYPPSLPPGGGVALRREIEALGLRVSNVNAFMLRAIGTIHHPSWIEPDPAERAKRVAHTLSCIELTRDLGAATLSTEPGGPLPSGVSRETAVRWFVEGLSAVLPRAEACGVELLVEPEPGLLVETSAQLLDLLPRVPSPALGVNFDVGHFFCVGEEPSELVPLLGRWIRHVHLEDIAADRRHFHLIPGQGAIDFDALFDALRAAGYRGYLTVEVYPEFHKPAEAAADSLAFLQPFLET
jgi:sugar phosphate isomerase/epimerase